jgi:hypothetical protein
VAVTGLLALMLAALAFFFKEPPLTARPSTLDLVPNPDWQTLRLRRGLGDLWFGGHADQVMLALYNDPRLFTKPRRVEATDPAVDAALWRELSAEAAKIGPPAVPGSRGFTPGDGRGARLFALGLDGATWQVLTPLIQQGRLPHFQKLLGEGSFGELRIERAFSPLSWISIASGKSATKAFASPQVIETWDLERASVATKRWWDILAEPDGADLALIDYYFPPNPGDYPRARVYCREPGCSRPTGYFDSLDFARSETSADVMSIQAIERVLAESPPRRLASIVRETDWRQHHTFFFFLAEHLPGWKRLVTQDRPLTEAYRQTTRNLTDLYERVDALLGRLMAEYPNDYLVILSDHGFHTAPPEILAAPSRDFLKSFRLDAAKLKAAESLTWHWRGQPYRVRFVDVTYRFPLFRSSRGGVDFTVVNREVHFQPRDVTRFTTNKWPDDLQAAVTKWNDSFTDLLEVAHENGETVLRVSERGLSLVRYAGSQPFAYALENSSAYNDHLPSDRGVFIARGPGLARGRPVSNVSIFDVTPTLLYLLGKPVGADMDGHVLAEAINPLWLAQRPITYVASHDDPAFLSSHRRDATGLSAAETARLKALGYFP